MAVLIGKHDQDQTGSRSVCSACGNIIAQLAVNQDNTCSNCNRKFCINCYKLKEKLEVSSALRSPEGDCIACDNVVRTKHNLRVIVGDEKNEPESDKQRRSYPVKPPRGIHGVQSFKKGEKEEQDRLDKSPQDNNPLQSSIYDPAKNSTNVAGHFKRQRNNRGLYSSIHIRDQDDNRNYLIFEQEQNTSPSKTLQTNLTRVGSDKQEQNRPMSSHFSKMNHDTNMYRPGRYNVENNLSRQSDAFRGDGSYSEKQENTIHSENDNGTIQSQRRTRNDRNIPQQGMRGWGPEEYQHPESPHRNIEGSAVSSENKSDEFPQNSQSNNETIYYPSPNKAYSNSGKKQLTYSSNRFQQSKNSDNPIGPADTPHHQNRALGYFHRGGNSRPYSAWHAGNGFYDDDDFEDLDDVPCYSDIPYALILTGNVDEKMLQKAMKKEEQRLALERITATSGKKTDEKISKKNKNQCPAPTSATNTYREEMLTREKIHTDEDLKGIYARNGSNSPLRSSVTPKEESNILSDVEPNSSTKHNDQTKQDTSVSSIETKREKSKLKDKELNDLSKASTTTSQIGKHKQDTVAPITKSNPSCSPLNDDKSSAHNDLESCRANQRKRANKGDAYSKEILLNSSNVMGDMSHTEKKGIKTSITKEFVKEKHNNEEEKSRSGPDVEKLSKEETERKKSERELLREKRLKVFNSKSMSHVENFPVDNREIAFNLDLKHKPIKSKAFRSKMPDFKSDKKIPDDGAAEYSSSDLHKSPPSSAAHSSRNTEDKKYSLATNQELKKDQSVATCSKQTTSGLQKSETTRNSEIKYANEPLSKETKKIGAKFENEETDDGVVPIAMKLLKKQEDRKKLSLQGSRHGKDENSTLPYAMRLLMTYKEENDSEKQTQGASQQRKTGNKLGSIFDIFSSLRGTSSSMQKSSTPKITELDSRPAENKQPKKNKNKNISTTLQKDQTSRLKENFETDDKRGDSMVIFGAKKQSTEEGNVDSKETGEDTYTLTPVLLINFAENRHKAFQRIKMSQSEENLKCTACGRPECQGHNIKKMKEIIRIAKQKGFEVRDVIPDGNCMFAAVVDQLQLYGDNNYGPKSLRDAAVMWLIEHPNSDDGTPLSSFLEEDWNSYLQRMMNEGEWGDHLVLKAIVETIGHTIKVLNVSGEESRWTILEPATIDTSKDGMHLVLGHVGEFHYTSLRPADEENRSFVQAPVSQTYQRAISEDNCQIALEGTETIEMFREDFIDTWSDMPTVHFSYLLKRVVPIKVLDNAAVNMSSYTVRMNEQEKMAIKYDGIELECAVEFGGSVFEGVYVSYLNQTINADSSTKEIVEFDMYEILKDCSVVAHKSDALLNSNKYVYTLETSGVHDGYTKLLRFDRHYGFSAYQPQLKINFLDNKSSQHINRRVVIRCPFWPDCAKSWGSRLRKEGWPSKEALTSIESEGCLLLPNAHKESKYPDIEWQFCFSLCERKLFRDALSKYQKYGYILFSAFCTQTLQCCKAITGTHLKSVFFYACERIPAEFWESCPGACVLYMLDELLRYIQTKNFPNFFVSTNNMISHLSEKDLKEIEGQIILLRSQPVLFLRQIEESLRATPNANFMIDKIVDDFPKFREHRSLKMTTLEVFIPATIDIALCYIRGWKFEEGYDLLSQAFQERLSVSTCDDSVPFQMFLPGAVSVLDLHTLVWFSAYTDRQLEGQLSKSLIRETCGDLKLVRIKEFLPANVVGSYGDTEVPYDFTRNICTFCNDFASFLYETNKLSEILPILYHCHDIFENKSEVAKTVQMNGGQIDMPMDDFTDEPMFRIYTAMYTVYKRQHQMEFFRAVMPVVKGIVKRLHTRGAYNCLCSMYKALGDNEQLMESSRIYDQLPVDPLERSCVGSFHHWPRAVYAVAYDGYQQGQ